MADRRHWLALLTVSLTSSALLLAGCGDDDEEPPGTAPPVLVTSLDRAPMPAPERTEVVGAWWDGKVAVVTGYLSDNTASAQVDFYDHAADAWTPGPPLPRALHHAGVGVLGGRLYVVGGYEAVDGGWKPVADVHSLGPGEAAWRQEPPLAGPRGALAVASTGDALVAVGGTGDGDLVRTEILESGSAGWKPGPDMKVRREHLAATAVGNRVYAIAGRDGSLESNRRSVESFEPGEDSWRAEPDLREARGGIGAATVGDRPCVAGGEAPGGRTIAPVECLVDGAWRTVGNLRSPRHGVAVVAGDDGFHVIGGGPEPGLFVSDDHEVFDLPES